MGAAARVRKADRDVDRDDWTDVDLRRRVLSITKSRDEGEENEPKTYGSMRVRRSQHLGQIGSTKTRARERPI
jgi:hypothetical protein